MATSATKQFISLQEAAEISPYSQEYLSLRARQGKLQAIKRGRNWSTTKAWLQEYVAKSDDYKSLVEEKRHAESIQKQEVTNAALIPWPDPPLSLPVHAPEADEWEHGTEAEVAARTIFWRKFQFVLATVTLIVFFGVSVTQGKDEIMRVVDDVSPVVISTSALVLSATEQFGFVVGEKIFVAGISELVQEYTSWLSGQFRSAGWRIAGWFTSSKEEEFVSQPVPQSEKKGLVVILSTQDDKKLKEQIKQSFSDEVIVTPYDAESGIITPVFRERKGEDYLYILVPLQNIQ